MSPKKKILVIVESPNKIKKISHYLGDDYMVVASFGHIMDLDKSKTNKLGVDVEHDFKPKYVVLPEKKDKLAVIINASSLANKIYLATDPDREGEAIAFHLKSCLESSGLPIKRITFNEITKSAVEKSVKNPGDLDQNLFDAQQARRVLDRLVGFLVSPFLMDCVGPNLSAGRVQSVALRLVVDREREIENFKPEEYWNIFAQLGKKTNNKENFQAKYNKKITNGEDAGKIKADLESANYLVTDVDAKEKKRNPFPPFTTPKLQQAAASRYGFPISKTMKAAQALYEGGYITYIRTDSTRLSPESLDMVRKWIGENGHDVPAKPNFYASKDSAQDAHEAIRPSDVYKTPDKVFLSEEQQKLYRLIWERFVACQMESAIYDTVSVTIKTSNGHELKANGRTLKYPGWLAISKDYTSSEDEGDVQLPILKRGEALILVPPNVTAEQKFTQPPPRYSEGSLVKELERLGIGRPSTYADIIEKIKGRGYVEFISKAYHPTDLGKKVVDILVKYFKFMATDYTASMEEDLDKIALGNLDYAKMLSTFFEPFKIELKSAYASGSQDYGIKCEKCNGKMLLRHGKFGFFLSCLECKKTTSCAIENDKPVVRTTYKNVVEGIICPKCNSEMIKRDGRYGPFYSCIKYPECNGSRKIPTDYKCEKCGTNMYFTTFDGVPKLACMGYPECRNIIEAPKDVIPNSWMSPGKIKTKKTKSYIKRAIRTKKKK